MSFKYIILDDVVDELNQKRIEDLFLGDIPKWERIITTTPGAGINIRYREKDIPWFSHDLIVKHNSVSQFTGAVWGVFKDLGLERYDEYISAKNL